MAVHLTITTDHPDQRMSVDAFSFKVVTAREMGEAIDQAMRETQKISNIPSAMVN